MEVVNQRCGGLDVHKKLVVACLILPDRAEQRRKELRTFRTTTQELLGLRDWLNEAGCTQVAMEATEVYWRPIDTLLEGAFEVLVVHARRVLCGAGAQNRWARCRMDR